MISGSKYAIQNANPSKMWNLKGIASFTYIQISQRCGPKLWSFSYKFVVQIPHPNESILFQFSFDFSDQKFIATYKLIQKDWSFCMMVRELNDAGDSWTTLIRFGGGFFPNLYGPKFWPTPFWWESAKKFGTLHILHNSHMGEIFSDIQRPPCMKEGDLCTNLYDDAVNKTSFPPLNEKLPIFHFFWTSFLVTTFFGIVIW